MLFEHKSSDTAIVYRMGIVLAHVTCPTAGIGPSPQGI